MKTAVLSSYMLLMLSIGYVGMRKTKDLNDFFLGGRQIGPWMSAFAYGTTYFSAVIFIGYAGKVGWSFGLSGLWIALGNSLVGTFLAWKLLARPTREITERLNARTMPEFLETRYNSPALKLFASVIIFVFLTPYSASVYMGLSYLFEGIFNLDYTIALVIMALLTAAYLTMGGYFAVSLTDLFQGFIMLGGVVMLVLNIIGHPNVGGLLEGISRLKSIDARLAAPVGPPGFWAILFLTLLTSLGPWGLPQMIQKFYSIRDENAIKPAMIVTTGFSLIISFGAYLVGSYSRLFFNTLPLEGGRPNPDILIPKMIDIAMPEALAAIILALVLSASMSSLSSLVLVSSSAISMDLIQGYLKPDIDKKLMMVIMRGLCILFIGISLVIALMKPAIILTLMAISWGTVAGVFLAPYLYGLFWKGTTKAGAWAGAMSGLLVSTTLSLFFRFDPQTIPMIGSLAMIIPLIVVPVVSIVTPGFSQTHIKKIFNKERVDC